jgi:hypothetical protein
LACVPRARRRLRRERLCPFEDDPRRSVGRPADVSGIELALSSKPQDYRDTDLFLVLLMAAIGVALNPVAAFAVGLPIAYGIKRGWLKV